MTARYCTRVIAIKQGGIIYDGDPRLTTHQLVDIYGEELRQIENPPILPTGEAAVLTRNSEDNERNFF
jgi:phosphonate transport system ATP-binding protein